MLHLVPSCFLIAILYLILRSWRPFYFKRLCIGGPWPLPIIGTLGPVFIKGFAIHDRDVIRKYGNLVGTFEGSKPSLLVSDPEMLKEILIKQFNNFPNRYKILSGDPANDLMLTQLGDDHWRHIRNLLTPTYSSGKLKLMMNQINECGLQLALNLGKEVEMNSIVDMREVFGAFTMDVIASTAFGLQLNSQQDRNNPFIKYAKRAFPPELNSPMIIISLFAQDLVALLNRIGYTLGVFPPIDVKEFFIDVIQQAIDGRKGDKKGGVDLLQLMLDVSTEDDGDGPVQETAADMCEGIADKQRFCSREKTNEDMQERKGMTKDEILAQALLILAAGYDTTASVISFLSYFLALNPQCQQRLHEEVTELMDGKGDQDTFDYEMVQKATYLDMCVKETLRICPAAIRMDRVASNDTVVNGIQIAKGTVIVLPFYGLHHNPKYWREPEMFDPERFSAENAPSIHPFQYLPFGGGPRICLGMKLAHIEIRVAIAHLIRQFRFVACDKTEIPITFTTLGPLRPVNGIRLKVEKR